MSGVDQVMSGYFKSMEHASDSIVYKRPLRTCDEYKRMNEPTLNEYYREMSKYYKFQMEQNVNDRAIFAMSNTKFTAIAVDGAREANGHNNVLFVGLSDGRVLKMLTKLISHESSE